MDATTESDDSVDTPETVDGERPPFRDMYESDEEYEAALKEAVENARCDDCHRLLVGGECPVCDRAGGER